MSSVHGRITVAPGHRDEPARDDSAQANPTFHRTYQTDTTGRNGLHRTEKSEMFGLNRSCRTSPTECSHLIIPRSWVRSPPALRTRFTVHTRDKYFPIWQTSRDIRWLLSLSTEMYKTQSETGLNGYSSAIDGLICYSLATPICRRQSHRGHLVENRGNTAVERSSLYSEDARESRGGPCHRWRRYRRFFNWTRDVQGRVLVRFA